MAIGREDHDIHKRRGKRNLWLGLVLAGFVALVFGVTLVKLGQGQMVEGFDHAVRPSITVSK